MKIHRLTQYYNRRKTIQVISKPLITWTMLSYDVHIDRFHCHATKMQNPMHAFRTITVTPKPSRLTIAAVASRLILAASVVARICQTFIFV